MTRTQAAETVATHAVVTARQTTRTLDKRLIEETMTALADEGIILSYTACSWKTALRKAREYATLTGDVVTDEVKAVADRVIARAELRKVLVEAVLEYAVRPTNYEDGWDAVVEHLEREQVAEMIGNATTVRGALWKMRNYVRSVQV